MDIKYQLNDSSKSYTENWVKTCQRLKWLLNRVTFIQINRMKVTFYLKPFLSFKIPLNTPWRTSLGLLNTLAQLPILTLYFLRLPFSGGKFHFLICANTALIARSRKVGHRIQQTQKTKIEDVFSRSALSLSLVSMSFFLLLLFRPLYAAAACQVAASELTALSNVG